MSGKRLGSFRSGDRSEYLAQFALSRIAYVFQVVRQEDFGVADFLCTLGKEEGRCVFPEDAFYVQVKSNLDKFAISGDAVKWISNHMDMPLLIAAIDKKTNVIQFFSTMPIWNILAFNPSITEIVIGYNDEFPTVPTEHSQTMTSFSLNLGKPICKMDIGEIEKNPGKCFLLLKHWISSDSKNITMRKTGRAVTEYFKHWETNEIPIESQRLYFFGPNYQMLEQALVPLLTALAHNYNHAKKAAELDAIRPILKIFQQHLDATGVGFINKDPLDAKKNMPV